MFDLADPAAIMFEINACRKACPNHYIKVNGYDAAKGRETVALSFIVQRPKHEPGFRLARQEGPGRSIRYAVESYATGKPEGERYPESETGPRR